eukprot:9346270-Ditylum_brightwellii.AAC.1
MEQLWANAVIDETIGEAMEHHHLIKGKNKDKWFESTANKSGRLAQGMGKRIKHGTNTIFFIDKKDLPQDRQATYALFVVDIRPQKAETHCIRLTVGGNLIQYPGKVHIPTADMDVAKLMFNSIISTPNAKFCTIAIKNFYLNTPMQHYEYMHIPIKLIPEEIIQQYELRNKVSNGHVYVEIRKACTAYPKQAALYMISSNNT